MAAAKSDPNAVTTDLLIHALNTMTGTHANRVSVARNNVPAAVFLMLEAPAVLALGFSGYGIARPRMHHRIAMLMMALMIGSVIS